MRRRLFIAVIALSTIGATTTDAPAIRTNATGLLEVVAAPGTTVRYTLDGSDPDRGSGAWLAPVDLPAGYTLKARAFSPDGNPAGDLALRESTATGARTPSTLVPVTQNRDWRIYDWADRHAACVALMKSRQPEIVMLGDSITHFWGGDPDGEGVAGRRTGVEEWNRFFAGRRVVNLGYGWDRTENVLWRLTHGEFDGVSPKVVVVMIGTNNMDLNTTDEIAAGITEICAILHGRSPADAHSPARHLPARGVARRDTSEGQRRQRAHREAGRTRRRDVPRHRPRASGTRRLDLEGRDVRLPPPVGVGLRPGGRPR